MLVFKTTFYEVENDVFRLMERCFAEAHQVVTVTVVTVFFAHT